MASTSRAGPAIDSQAIDPQWINCQKIEQLDEELKKANNSNKLLVVYFTAMWCGPCRRLEPFLPRMIKVFGDVIFVKIDIDQLESVAFDWRVEALPTFMFVKDGVIVDKVIGSDVKKIRQKIADHAARFA